MTDHDMLKSVSRALSARKIPDRQLAAIAAAMAKSRNQILGADVCTHGICIDVGITGSLDELALHDILEIATGPIKHIEIFPEGIIVPDRARVRVTHAL